MGERKCPNPFFRQWIKFCAALVTGWPPDLRPFPPANHRPGRLKCVDGITAASRKDFRAPETHHGRIRCDFANFRKRRRKSSYLPERALVAWYLHRYAGSGRNTTARAQAADARGEC